MALFGKLRDRFALYTGRDKKSSGDVNLDFRRAVSVSKNLPLALGILQQNLSVLDKRSLEIGVMYFALQAEAQKQPVDMVVDFYTRVLNHPLASEIEPSLLDQVLLPAARGRHESLVALMLSYPQALDIPAKSLEDTLYYFSLPAGHPDLERIESWPGSYDFGDGHPGIAALYHGHIDRIKARAGKPSAFPVPVAAPL